MSVCTFLAADCKLPEKPRPETGFDIKFNIDTGTVYDGGRDDDYALYNFTDVGGYSDLQYGVMIEWFYCTPGRARKIIEHIKSALTKCDRVEIWTVWLMDYYEYDERPYYKTRTVSLEDLSVEDIKEIAEVNVWEASKERPTYYCLTVEF